MRNHDETFNPSCELPRPVDKYLRVINYLHASPSAFWVLPVVLHVHVADEA